MRKGWFIGAAIMGVLTTGQAALAHIIEYNFVLNSPQVVPGVISPAWGEGYMAYNHHTVFFSMTIDLHGIFVEDLAASGPNATPIHMHLAPRGENGPIVVDLGLWGTFTPTADGSRFTIASAFLGGQQGDEIFSDWFQVQTALFNERIYVDVHTAQYPGGQVRGQIPAPATGLALLGLFALRRRR
ncbi:MAG: CHRD domain-containing protein [Phycisphaerales bacterium]|nr:CHRD domain-containing protein [Phycisphaerales bacterium]